MRGDTLLRSRFCSLLLVSGVLKTAGIRLVLARELMLSDSQIVSLPLWPLFLWVHHASEHRGGQGQRLEDIYLLNLLVHEVFNASSEGDTLCSALMCHTEILILSAHSQRPICLTHPQISLFPVLWSSSFQAVDQSDKPFLPSCKSIYVLPFVYSLCIPSVPPLVVSEALPNGRLSPWCFSGLPLRGDKVRSYFIFCLHPLTKLTHLWIKLVYSLSHQLVVENAQVARVWAETKAPEIHGFWELFIPSFVSSGPAWAWFGVYHICLINDCC